jgi:hypothetical protein
MKMLLGNTPVNSLNVKYFEMDTNDCTMVASDLQAGITAVARGQKITGTGKSFEFASYGTTRTNMADFIPAQINVIEVASIDYPIRSLISFDNMYNIDFSIEQTIGMVTIDGVEYPITSQFDGLTFTLKCEKTIDLEVFLGKDNYV